MSTISEKVSSLGLELPAPSAAVGSYVPQLILSNMLYISGQLPLQAGTLAYTGNVFDNVDRRSQDNDRRQEGDRAASDRRSASGVSIDEAIKAAQLCGLNIISQISDAVGDDLDRVEQIVRLGGFVSCCSNFSQHPKVINGASDLMVAVFGEAIGKHVRAATGASSLPLDASVEIEATVLIKP